MMKIILFICILAFSAFGQTIKTPDARRLEAVDIDISKAQKQLDIANERLRELRVRFSEEHRSITEQKAVVAAREAKLIPLTKEKEQLLLKQMTVSLPITQTELLKILIMQNERIIDLLTDQAKPKDSL